MSDETKKLKPINFNNIKLTSSEQGTISNLLDELGSQLFPKIDFMVEALRDRTKSWQTEQMAAISSLQAVAKDLDRLSSILQVVENPKAVEYLNTVDQLVEHLHTSCNTMWETIDSVVSDTEYYQESLANLRYAVFPTPDLETQILMGIKSESMQAIEELNKDPVEELDASKDI